MSYMPMPLPLQTVTGPDQQIAMPMVPMDQYDQPSTFDAETFIGSEDAYSTYHLQQLPPQLKRYPPAYEDPFSDVQSGYEQSIHPHEPNGVPESPSIESNNKLLSFSLPVMPYTILTYTMQRASISMSAQLHGMFFLAESPWATAADVQAPSELTCYRRNLFQITGTITLPRNLQFLMTEQGDQIPILAQELTISATESLEGNPVKIISVPWKTPATSTAPVEDKTEKEPPMYPLDLSTGQDMDSEYVSFPISWKRLQFRIATANNGRRKELQQHFVVRLKVVATLASGVKVPVCEIQSGAIIVRGRSPRNFQARKDMPISGGTAARKVHTPQQSSRTPTGDTNQNTPKQTQAQPAPPSKPADLLQMPFDFGANDIPPSPDFAWKVPAGAMTTIPPDPPSSQMHHATPYAQSTPEVPRGLLPKRASIAPVSLSLTDDEPPKAPSPNDQHRKRATPVRPPSFSIGVVNSPDESADLLYEYFPLGLDDWMPPVDAVYRPHVVHHITPLPQDSKIDAGRTRSKRYFSDAW
ncbi:hypothetical protein CFE70_009681 [Pyrenophora teres f. teres 0-1]|uniref:NDT80 domain-containing protein n=2 Tax=Pyrenophora teres f. teres TaxID=97479 RepID=E3RYH5_PYRTT|nr:hypothetical protein PTT_14589 [Pyrenophora teres f. teres 0-1]KAE8827105.1 hypothetical protein HRS9139_08277 [Pyrenophora teres f. teres]KAE8832624.1 hypothetical protein PTNB85_07016 [Pyrenophora teres f. teres]KAE8836767.1 hypothetical protein HRS9122_06922 [Pyrenophora teres f. teres]KAE8856285.1 hypothetical protein PTNB29_09124 [Pyrenophora teres f. teres]